VWTFKEKFPLNRLLPVKYPLILLYFSLAVSVGISQDRANSVTEVYKYCLPLLILWAVVNLDQKRRQLLIDCLMWAGFVVGLIALRQYFFGFDDTLRYLAENNINDPEAVTVINRRRVFFPFVTPDVLAGYLIMILPLALLRRKFVLAIPMLLALLLTRSLGGLLSLLLALLIYFCANGKLGRKAVLGLSGLFAAVAVVFIIRGQSPDGHLHPWFSVAMRLDYWQDTLAIIREYMLTGVGLGNVDLCNCRYSHNAYLQFWAETGILGVASLAWLAARVLGQNRGVSVLSTALIAFLIHNLVEFTFFLPEAVFIWWVIAGLSLDENAGPATKELKRA
jgi:O-antigen ligase